MAAIDTHTSRSAGWLGIVGTTVLALAAFPGYGYTLQSTDAGYLVSSMVKTANPAQTS